MEPLGALHYTRFLQNLKKSFGKTQVIHDLSIDVKDGELIVIVGPSGCGKSTLLRLLARILSPHSGTIHFQGQVGFVFQNPDHQLVMPTVGADVAFGLVAEKLSKLQVRNRVKDALSTVNLLELERRPIYALSGGQKQRIAIARALAGHPQLIMADEPTAALDSQNGQLIIELLCDLAKQKETTVVIVTHDVRIKSFAWS